MCIGMIVFDNVIKHKDTNEKKHHHYYQSNQHTD